MSGTASGMSHRYKEERILIGCEDVSCCAFSLSFFILSLTTPELLVKKKNKKPKPKQNNNPIPGKGIACLF
jgi:hypothetical protein